MLVAWQSSKEVPLLDSLQIIVVHQIIPLLQLLYWSSTSTASLNSLFTLP